MGDRGRHRAQGKAARGVLILLLVLVVAAGGLYLYGTGASGASQPVAIDIPPGATAGAVGEILEDAGVIRSSLAFSLSARFRGLGESLQSGAYDLRTNMPVSDVFEILEAGPIVEIVEVTFPEGLEVSEVAGVAGEALGVDPEAFEEAATGGDFALPPYLPEGKESVEGFLFPKTYEFPPEADEAQVITRLLAQFEAEARGLPWDRAGDFGLKPYEVVIVASLIEREARVEADRANIAAVIYNRLRRDMPLQIDATIQYALPENNRLLTEKDYEFESPYNTYLHAGLPPTPIASPGLASLQAALSPADAEYLYFVVVNDQTGEHAFAETYQEFLRLKAEAGVR